MIQYLQSANKILTFAALDYDEFSRKYSRELICFGEKEFDGALFSINLSEEYLLIIEFKEYNIVDFEIRSLPMSKKMLENEILRVCYPV